MEQPKALVVFEGKNIRRVWHDEQWWFVAIDIVAVLTDSTDPSGYLKDMRRRDESFAQGWGQIATPLPVQTSGGIQRLNCVSTKGAFRLIQSVPSVKAEPFKQWLAKVGYERVQEIENPELAQNRAKEYYQLKGYPKDWIEKRIRGIAIRQELTDEWKDRGVTEEKDFALLTNEISTATFGKTVQEYKQFKGLKRENLRDHMNDIELILTMLGEATTTRFTRDRDSKEWGKLQRDAQDGGDVAGATRTDIEQKLGKTIVSNENFLDGQKSKKRLI